jgi:hypothetical protein
MSQAVPDAAAPPSEVREFISHLLQEREIPQTDIQNITPKWKIGSGREMRGYDPAMYLEIFGAEYGWIIYREVKLRIHEEKCQKLSYKYCWGEFVLQPGRRRQRSRYTSEQKLMSAYQKSSGALSRLPRPPRYTP